jgi:ABC-type bacteriocin/lantibiotic exporter with double-glycine peptidase domain
MIAPSLTSRPARRAGLDALLLAAALSVAASAAWAAWARWGAVPQAPEHPMPPGAEVRQWSVTTCGPAAVATILNAYGRLWTPAALERECGLTPEGASLYGLREACLRHGLRAEGMLARSPSGLLRAPRPYIAYFSSGHFVVVERLRGDRLEIFDPTAGDVTAWTPGELYRRGSGWILAVGMK